MFKTNEYFDGKVMSISITTSEGPATVGVMAVGEFEFGTSSKEYMTVTSGNMLVKLPGSDKWEEFKQNTTFIVEPNEKFQVKTVEETAYICRYK